MKWYFDALAHGDDRNVDVLGVTAVYEVAGATQVREQVSWSGHASPSQSGDVRPPDY